MITKSTHHSNRSRIAVVVQKYGLVGGGEKFVFELTERLAQDPRWQLHVFANQWRKGSDVVQFHHVPIIGFPRFLKPLSFAYFANRRIDAAGMNLVHTHERIFRADLLTAHGIPHTAWVREIRQKRPSLFDRTIAKIEQQLVASQRCRRILAVSSIVKEKMAAIFPEAEKRIEVIHPGVDTTPYDRLNRNECRLRIRKKFGIPESDRIILFVGMNFEVKGLGAIVAAFAGLRKAAPHLAAKLLVVGKGDTQRYKVMARQHGIEGAIEFTGVWREEIAPVYMAADLFIMLSAFDTFGLTVLEAMAAGLPVIISPNVGAKDLVRHGENGFVVAAHQTEKISLCMAEALAKPEGMAHCAHQTAAAHSWLATTDRVSATYAEILEKG